MKQFQIATQKSSQLIEITDPVSQIVAQSGVPSGICVVCVPHTTAGITIQENADPDVVHDILLWLNRFVPRAQSGFRHAEGNSDSHIKTCLMGNSVSVVIQDGRLIFGTWQGIYLCEFDGPRTRSVQVQIQAG